MRKTYLAALAYLVAGLAAGLFYRELTKAQGFDGRTQLAVVHTHLLVLGLVVLLLVLVLQAALRIPPSRTFTAFFWTYNAGVVVTAAAMTVHGTLTVLGRTSGPAVAGVAGTGHLLVAVGLGLFFVVLGRAVRAFSSPELSVARAARPR